MPIGEHFHNIVGNSNGKKDMLFDVCTSNVRFISWLKKKKILDFSGGPVVRNPPPMQGTWV